VVGDGRCGWGEAGGGVALGRVGDGAPKADAGDHGGRKRVGTGADARAAEEGGFGPGRGPP